MIRLQFLIKTPAKRLGSGDKGPTKVKSHAFFKMLDWGQAEQLQLIPPFLPSVDDLGLRNFDATFASQAAELTPIGMESMKLLEQQEEEFSEFWPIGRNADSQSSAVVRTSEV